MPKAIATPLLVFWNGHHLMSSLVHLLSTSQENKRNIFVRGGWWCIGVGYLLDRNVWINLFPPTQKMRKKHLRSKAKRILECQHFFAVVFSRVLLGPTCKARVRRVGVSGFPPPSWSSAWWDLNACVLAVVVAVAVVLVVCRGCCCCCCAGFSACAKCLHRCERTNKRKIWCTVAGPLSPHGVFNYHPNFRKQKSYIQSKKRAVGKILNTFYKTTQNIYQKYVIYK